MKLWIGLVAGFTAGITVGLLFAPARGSVTRRRIAQTAGDLADTSCEKVHDVTRAARRKARHVSQMTNERIQKVSDFASGKADDIGRAVEAVTGAVTEKFHRRTA
ncbi:MAG TPA: YtxH domain-containing protein [Terracidiphilus sp.]